MRHILILWTTSLRHHAGAPWSMPARLALSPGTGVYRRSPHRLQVGLNPGLILDATPGLEDALRLIDGVRPVEDLHHEMAQVMDRDPRPVVEALRSAGLVVEHIARLGRTAPATVGLQAVGPIAELTGHLERTLDEARIRLSSPADCDHLVVITDGEPSRGLLERFQSDQVAHTVVSALPGHLRWGPTISEPLDPCWGCVDAHFADVDPGWPALTTQFGLRTSTPAVQGLSPAHLHTAVGHIAHELVTIATTSKRPMTGRMTILRADLSQTTIPLPRHPECGCSLLPLTSQAVS